MIEFLDWFKIDNVNYNLNILPLSTDKLNLFTA